jgi:hypothetical protein
MTSTLPKGTLGSVVASLLAATLYQGNPDKKHKLWNTRNTTMSEHFQNPKKKS